MRKSGAVSRHQRDATADDLLALLNSVIAGAVFSESMLASAYIGCEAMYAAEEARHDGGSCSQLVARLNGGALSVGYDGRMLAV